jgi:hypothetical protein
MVIPKLNGEFCLGDGVDSNVSSAICIRPIRSGATKATRCIEYFLPVGALSYVSILSIDFNQSSACSGSKELENVGGL